MDDHHPEVSLYIFVRTECAGPAWSYEQLIGTIVDLIIDSLIMVRVGVAVRVRFPGQARMGRQPACPSREESMVGYIP